MNWAPLELGLSTIVLEEANEKSPYMAKDIISLLGLLLGKAARGRE